MPFEDQVIVKFTADMSSLMAGINSAASAFGRVGGGQQASRTAGGIATVTRNTQQLTRVTGRQNQELSRSADLMKELQTQTGGVSSSFRQASHSIQSGIGWLDKFAIQTDRASMVMWKFSMGAIGLRDLAMTTGTVAAGLGMVTKEMVSSVSLIDRVKRQFASIYQSAEIGGQMVDQLVTDAVKIRYTVNEVLDAGRLLALEGFNPKDLIYDMADLAAGVNQEGITIVNATRAFVDATNGQFRRLKETFQVTREDAMQFAPDAFAGPNGQITNQAKAVEAIIRAIRAKYRGQNAATMQTIQGMMSNLDDAMTRSMAKMGTAIQPTVMKWLETVMGFFDKLGKFADSGLGKATAQTILWSTAIMTAVSALALLGGGLMTAAGLFAAYRTFVSTRQEGVMNIIKAELELLAVTKEIAEYDAMRSSQDIAAMKMKLELTKAIYAEEQQRLANTGIPLAEPARKLIGGRSLAQLAADRRMAQARVDVLVKPRELLGINDNMEKVQEEIAAIEATSLGRNSERYRQLKQQEAVLQRQQDYMRAQVADAHAIARGEAGGKTDAVLAAQAQADATEMAAAAAAEETKALQLQSQAEAAGANVTRLKQQADELATLATDAKTASINANTAALQANAAAQDLALMKSEKQKVVGSLATSRDVELYALDTQIREQKLSNMQAAARKAAEKGTSADAEVLANLQIQRLETEIAQRHEKLPQLQSQAAARIQAEEELGVLERELRDAELLAATRDREAKAARDAYQERSRSSRENARSLAEEERSLAALNEQYERQAVIAGNAQAEAAALAGVASGIAGAAADKAQSVQSGGGGTSGGAAAEALRQQRDARAAAVARLETEAETLATAIEQNAVGEAGRAAMREELALTQMQLDQDRMRLATLEGILAAREGEAAAAAAGGAASLGRSARFGRGFSGGFGGVFKGIGEMFAGLFSPLKAAIASVTGAIVNAGGLVAVLGVVTGGLAALAVIAGVAVGAWKLFVDPVNKARKSLDEAATAAEDFASRMNRAAGMLPLSPAAATGASNTAKFLKDLEKYQQAVGKWQVSTGEAARPMKWAAGQQMSEEDQANFARRFWEGASQSADNPALRQYLSKFAEQRGGWNNMTREDLAQLERDKYVQKQMVWGDIKYGPQGESRQWARMLGRIGQSANAEQQGLPSTEALQRQSDAAVKQIENIRQLTQNPDQAQAEAQLKAQYGFGSLAAAKEFLETADKSTDKVGVFNEEVQQSYKTYKDMAGDVKTVNDLLGDQNTNLLSETEIKDQLQQQANTAQIAYDGMLATSRALYDVDVLGRKEREKDLALAWEKVRATKAQLDYVDAIRRLAVDQNNEGLFGAAGMSGLGSIFGKDLAAGQWASSLAELDPKKRQQLMEGAIKSAAGNIEDTSQLLDMYAPNANASVTERANYERQKAVNERRRMDARERLYRWTMGQANLTPEQTKAAEDRIAAERFASNRTAAESEKRAADLEGEDRLKQMQSYRDMAGVAGYSPRQLAVLDQQILQTKMKQAIANNDIAEQMALQVQYAQLLKGLGDDELNTEEAKLSYMQTQADQGLISQEAVDAEKQRMAQLYRQRAQQAAYGSAEYYQLMQKALQTLGGETENQWDTIIGKIIGAPQSLLNSVISEGWITKNFGNVANAMGLSSGIQADIISQRKSEMTVRITWDDINAIDGKVNAAVESGMNGFARDFRTALAGA